MLVKHRHAPAPMNSTLVLDSMSIPYRLVNGLKDWAPTGHIFSISEEDFLVLEIKHPKLFERMSHRDAFGPDDDEEMKVMCWDCGGSVFSVSGYEFKETPQYRRYICNKKNGVCEYEVNTLRTQW